MLHQPKQVPPPIPKPNSEVDQARILAAVFVAIVLLSVIVIVVLFLQLGKGGPNTSDNIASASSGDRGQNGEGTKGVAETNEKSSGDHDGSHESDLSQSTENRTDDEASLEAESEEVANNNTSDDQSNREEQSSSIRNEQAASQSKRRVRNTFNPFGSTLPPKKSPQKVAPVEGESADFFGVEAEGKSFVYVDKSSSMMMGKFIAAREELIESIDKLRPDQRFFVIFFDSSFHPQPTKGLVLATPRNKKVVKEWMMRADPTLSTEPFEAIKYGLELHPDAIYVLSDGEFDPSVVFQVSAINSDYTTPIHTIAFTNKAQTLKELAEQNKGTYRFVP